MSTQKPAQHEDKMPRTEQNTPALVDKTGFNTKPVDRITIEQAKRHPASLHAQDVQRLQRTIGNQAVGQLLGNTRPTAPQIQRSAAQKAVSVTPEEKQQLSGKICFDAVAFALKLEGAISDAQYSQWGNTNADALSKLVNQNDTLANSPNIPENSVVGVFRRNAEGGPLLLSHVMLSLGGGLAIGSNNGCIGGTGDWSVQDLAALLSWPPGGGNPTLGPTLEPNAPGWARERVIHYRPVSTAVSQF